MEMESNVESAGAPGDTIRNVHASIDTIDILHSADVACGIAVIGIDERAALDGIASSVAIGGIGGIVAKFRATSGA
jgi:hypothetical protein